MSSRSAPRAAASRSCSSGAVFQIRKLRRWAISQEVNRRGRDLRTGGLTITDGSGNSFALADRELPHNSYWTFGRENSTARNGGV